MAKPLTRGQDGPSNPTYQYTVTLTGRMQGMQEVARAAESTAGLEVKFSSDHPDFARVVLTATSVDGRTAADAAASLSTFLTQHGVG